MEVSRAAFSNVAEKIYILHDTGKFNAVEKRGTNQAGRSKK